MSFPLYGDSLDTTIEDDPSEYYGIRDGTLFVVDATLPMFEIDPDAGMPYFLECIQQYKQILDESLVWNRQDWVGMILFGTKKWDMDPETKNILTLQKLELVSVDNLKEVMKIEDGGWEYYKKISTSESYPLHDVLWHAALAFSSIKITMAMRKVILFTCQDNPPMTDNNEKHRIRVKASSFNDIGLQLLVVGLGNKWNHERFYKDLELLSGKIDKEDYKRTSLKDIVAQVKLPSRNMARLPWRLGENVILDVTVRSLIAKTKYLKKESMSKETNVPLTTHSYLRQVELADDEDEEEGQNDGLSSPVLETDIRKYQEFGHRKICFLPDELRKLSNTHEPGIDIICIKPICCDPMYHYQAPYFVTHSKSNRKDNKLLFGALLHKCESKNLMILCTVTLRKHSASKLYTMIPDTEKGGFYLYVIPFRENVRDLNDQFLQYAYNEDDKKPPTNTEDIDFLKEVIEKLGFEYDPECFPNPKLQTQLQTLKTLALDLERSEAPLDLTVPHHEAMAEKIGRLIDRFNNFFTDKREASKNTKPAKKLKKIN